MKTNDWFYFRFEELSSEIRIRNNLKPDTKNRLDCTKFVAPEENLRGLTFFVNNKGMLYFNRTPVNKICKANIQRQAALMLTGLSINLTSVYIENIDYPEYAFGNPPYSHMLGKKKRKPNPLFTFRNDLYLFITNKDYSLLEMIIVPNLKNYWTSYYIKLYQGELNQAIDDLRKRAEPFFDYGL